MPDPVHVATICGVEGLSVPPTNPAPVPVQVTSDAGSTVTPDRKSSLACTVSVTRADSDERAFAVMVTGPGDAGT
jgi:hypothetical protein